MYPDMNRFLLFILLAFSCVTGASAYTDGQTYQTVDQYGCQNLWILDRVHANDAFSNDSVCHTRARTAVMSCGIIYVSRSEAKTVYVSNGTTTDTIAQSVIYRFDAKTGNKLSTLDVTLNGEPYGTFLGVASIGRDNFGHVWVAPMTSNVQTKIPVYMLNVTTGELTLITEMQKGDVVYRTDYLDVMGDLTLQQAECNIMTVAGSSADPGFSTVYRWHGDKGGSWAGGFSNNDPSYSFTQFYPETKTGFSLAPVVRQTLGYDDASMYHGDFFYIDCFDAYPVLYDLTGTLVDSFEGVENELQPDARGNGCEEFSLDGTDFLAYVAASYDGNGHGCQTNIVKLGAEKALTGMKKYWQLPADSLGKVSDTGLRVQSITIDVENVSGNDVATVFVFKSNNGLGVWTIGKGVSGVSVPETEKIALSVTYYNLTGQQSAKPFNGVNLVKTTYTDGSCATSKMIK